VPLIAYVGDASEHEIELSVRASLENISVPLHVLGLPHLPMLTNGKPDLRAISEL
jgi:acyl-CoA synthetase (AMP-forming)/AMP-acid ligase II